MAFNPLDYGEPVEEQAFNPLEYGEPVEREQPVITEAQPITEDKQAGMNLSGAVDTMSNIGKVYPAIETGLNLLTSTYGIPAAGFGGLATLFATGDLQKANKAIQKLQEALVYMPKTASGQQLTGAVSYPFEKLEQGAETVGGKIEDAGYPNVAAGVHSAISSLPVLAGAKMALSKTPKQAIAAIDTETSMAIKSGVNKAVRPSVAKKGTNSQVKKYFNQAESAITEIVKNKDNLNLIDDAGAKVEGLPKTLDQFSQAIEQTKRNIFEEYDSLAKQSDTKVKSRPVKYPVEQGESVVFNEAGKGTAIEAPIKIDLDKTANQLNTVIKSKVLQDLSPETIKYAEMRAESWKGRKNYTAVETQEAIQMLNQTLEQFYRDPSPDMKGKAVVDSTIANDLRIQLDKTIQETTGKEYSAIKKKYGDLKAIESDVTKRSIVDARKNNKGLIDFSDIFTGGQAIKAMLTKDPATMMAAGGAKGLSKYYKMLNDPNRIVKNMFSDVEALSKSRVSETLKPQPGQVNIPKITETILNRYKMGDFSQQQIAAFDELRRRGAL